MKKTLLAILSTLAAAGASAEATGKAPPEWGGRVNWHAWARTTSIPALHSAACRTSANPLALKTVSYPVCRFTATAPDYTRWRVANTGIAESIHGVFAEDGDTVVVSLKRIGQTIKILQ